MTMNDFFETFVEKINEKSVIVTQKNAFSFVSLNVEKIRIINYFMSIDQFEFIKIKSLEFEIFSNCFNSTSIKFISINHKSLIVTDVDEFEF